MAGMLFVSGTLLFYTAMVVPAQIFLWDYSDPCHIFPTLYFDIFVDAFFLVSSATHSLFEITFNHPFKTRKWELH
jgi:hypothetical protein